jgi:hypothetical protein
MLSLAPVCEIEATRLIALILELDFDRGYERFWDRKTRNLSLLSKINTIWTEWSWIGAAARSYRQHFGEEAPWVWRLD